MLSVNVAMAQITRVRRRSSIGDRQGRRGKKKPERLTRLSVTMPRKLPAPGSADPRVAEVPLMDIIETIKEQIANNTILLYMKGSPNAPQCGFSARAAQAVMGCGEKFAYVDILQNPEIRAELPKYANWPTFPQLWVNGELVGGSDIMLEMFEKGELQTLIKEASAVHKDA